MARDKGSNPLSLLLAVLVRGYQLIVSPWLAPTCRYYPSCSAYALGALRIHNPLTALVLATWRLLRCNPWSKGGVDPVPGRGRLPWQEAWRRRREARMSTDGDRAPSNGIAWGPEHQPHH